MNNQFKNRIVITILYIFVAVQQAIFPRYDLHIVQQEACLQQRERNCGVYAENDDATHFSSHSVLAICSNDLNSFIA